MTKDELYANMLYMCETGCSEEEIQIYREAVEAEMQEQKVISVD